MIARPGSGAGFHHDGSPLYVSTQAPALGEIVTVFLRGPSSSGVRRVQVRSTPDGEPRFTEALVDRVRGDETWWRAEVEVRNPVTGYRFLLAGRYGHRWLTAAGVVEHDVPDSTDFRLVAYAAPPAWTSDAVVYQIFPDRFARSSTAAAAPTPDWAIPCDWDTPVIGRGPETPRQLYGGDLDGVVEHLDHIADLGANAVYLTPFFEARSVHRYNATSFEHVDPVLGGNAALDRLADAVHRRGFRLIGDITTNHTGDAHEWFTGADRKDFYYWLDDGTYEAWLGVSSLPKLNWGSTELRRRFFDGPDATATRWLRQLDGWRVDVANMTGRRGADDYTVEVAALMADALRSVRPDALLIGEHTADAGANLDRGGWQGTMNYAGFTRPMWGWLSRHRTGSDWVPGRRSARIMLASMQAFAAGMSWRSRAHSWNIASSHDSPRIRTIVGRPDLVELAVGLQVTLPGVPMVYAGDEFGLEGANGEDGRRPMPWHRPETWHRPTLARYRDLLRLRSEQPALRHGGLRPAYIDADAIAFWRETAQSRLLVLLRRASGTPIRLPGVSGENLYGGADLVVSDGMAVLPSDGPTVQVWECGPP